MLYSIEVQKPITHIPYREHFDRWCKGLSTDQYEAIMDELKKQIEGTEIQTSSWMPGNDWSGTVYEPIYSQACDYDQSASGRFFGLLVWVAMLEHPEYWGFGRYEKNGIPIEGLTYFRVTPGSIFR